MVLRHKFNAKPTEIDGKKFKSKKEAQWYQKLKHRQETGEILFFLREVPFELPGSLKYRLDFMCFLADGTVELIEVKGFHTPMGDLKLKQVMDLYGISIEVV